MTQPCAAHLANVAPHWNSASSGWATMANARAGVGRFSCTERSWLKRHPVVASEIVRRVDVPRQCVIGQHSHRETYSGPLDFMPGERSGAVRKAKSAVGGYADDVGAI